MRRLCTNREWDMREINGTEKGIYEDTHGTDGDRAADVLNRQ